MSKQKLSNVIPPFSDIKESHYLTCLEILINQVVILSLHMKFGANANKLPMMMQIIQLYESAAKKLKAVLSQIMMWNKYIHLDLWFYFVKFN